MLGAGTTVSSCPAPLHPPVSIAWASDASGTFTNQLSGPEVPGNNNILSVTDVPSDGQGGVQPGTCSFCVDAAGGAYSAYYQVGDTPTPLTSSNGPKTFTFSASQAGIYSCFIVATSGTLSVKGLSCSCTAVPGAAPPGRQDTPLTCLPTGTSAFGPAEP